MDQEFAWRDLMEGCFHDDDDMNLRAIPSGRSRSERSPSPTTTTTRTQRERSRSRDNLYKVEGQMTKEEAETMLQALLSEESQVELETKSFGEVLSFGNDKVLMELRSEVPFVFRIAELDLTSRFEDTVHVIKLDLPSCFTGFQTLECKPQAESDQGKQVTIKFKTINKKDASALRESGVCFIWCHDGMYLKSMGGITASMFNPPLVSRKTRYELEKQHVAPTVFFNFEDEV